MVKRILYLLIVVIFIFSSSGCASIVGKNIFPVTINSNPDGANIVIQDEKKEIVSFLPNSLINLKRNSVKEIVSRNSVQEIVSFLPNSLINLGLQKNNY